MSQKTSKFCWGCGNQLKTGQKFCTRCGKVVTSQIKPTQAIAEKQQNTSSNYGKLENKTVHEQPVFKEKSVELGEIEKKIDDLRSMFGDKFEKLEYKVNGLNVENKLIDLKSKFDGFLHEISNMKEFKKLEYLDKLGKLDKLDSLDNLNRLATAEDLRKIDEKINNLNNQDLDSKLSALEEKLNSKLNSIEESIDSFQSDSKIVNLATNTVERLNNMDKNLENFNIETRTRLSKMDNKIDELNSSLSALVPTLLKLNEKVSKLLIKPTNIHKGAKKPEEASKPPKTKNRLDLPPFPA